MKQNDNRLTCSDEKKNKIKMSKQQTSLRRQSQIVKVYECKIVEKRLNRKQKEELEMLFVEGKWFYNHMLNLRKSQEFRDINVCHLKEVKHFNKDKEEIISKLDYLSAAQKQAIQTRMISNEMTIKSLVKRGFQKYGNLQFKSELNCIPLKQYGQTYRFKSFNKVKIQGISKTILVRTGDQLQNVDELANANLIKKPDGYYLKVTAYINKENFKTLPSNEKEIGLDFGIKTNITTSEGEKICVSIEESDRLKKLQKEMFRRTKGSNNRYKTIKKIQKEYQKISNKKQDKANKIVSKLKKYKTIVIQDEQIANWHKGLFGKQVQNSCMGLIKSKLKQLSQTIILDKWIPTTKLCPKCLNKQNMSLDKRTYICKCGYQEDRDIHSAKNMLVIKDLVFSKLNFILTDNQSVVPTEHREITLMEFKASVNNTGSVIGKSEC